MSKNFNHFEEFVIGNSRWLNWASIGLHLLAVLACWLNGLDTGYKVILTIVVLISHTVSRAYPQTRPIFLRYTSESGWSIRADSKSFQPIQINPTTVIGRMLTTLHYDTDSKTGRALAIANDSLHDNAYRKLIVTLKISYNAARSN